MNNIRRVLTACAISVLAPFSAGAAETSGGPRFEIERDWSGELRPRYRGPQVEETAPAPIPAAPIPQAAPQVETPPPTKPRAQANVQVTREPDRRERKRESEDFAWQGPSWESDDRRRGPARAWSERERRERAWREREYAEREYAERIWQEEERMARDRRERLRERRGQRSDFRDEDEIYWDDCNPDWDRC